MLLTVGFCLGRISRQNKSGQKQLNYKIKTINNMTMEQELDKLVESVYNNHIKPLSDNPQPLEYCDYSDAKEVVQMVLKSELISNMLYYFWQDSSDSCPLDVGEAEKQELKFRDFVNKLTLKLQ